MVDYIDNTSSRFYYAKVKIICTRDGLITIYDKANDFKAVIDKKCLQQFMQLLYMVTTGSGDIRRHSWQTESVSLFYHEQPIIMKLFGSNYYRANHIRLDRANFVLQCLEKRFKTTIKKDKDYYKSCTIKHLKELLES